MLVVGAIGGFVLFFIIGASVLKAFNSSTATVWYGLVSFIGACWLATKPGSRGFAIGIFLGLGAVLLLMAICSGMQPI
jgi:hypothetical protein